MADKDYASFRIALVDDVSSSADAAAEAMENLQRQLTKDTKALADVQKALRNLRGAAQPNTKEIQRLETAAGQLKERLSDTQQKFLGMGGTFARTAKASSGFREQLAALAKASQALPGPLGQLFQKLSLFVANASAGKLALLGLASGMIAVGVGAVSAAKSLTQFAIATADARRNELLQLEAVTKMRTVYAATYGLARDKAEDLQGAIDRVSASVSIGRDQVAQYAMQLERSGVRGRKLETALDAVSTAASGWGTEQANQTLAWSASLALTGQSVDKLAARVKNQIGGVVQRKMLGLEVQQQKLRESQAALFTGISISGLLTAKKGLNDLFAQSTASGRVLKAMLGGLVQPLIDGSTLALKAVKILFQELIIWTLRGMIAWYDLRIALKQAGDTIGQNFTQFKAKMVGTWDELVKAFGAGVDKLVEYQDALGAIAIVTAGKISLTVVPAIWAMVTGLWASAKAAAASGKAFAVDLAKGIWKAIPAMVSASLQAARTAVTFLVSLAPAIWAGVVAFGSMAVAVLAATWPFVAAVVGVWAFIKVLKFLWDWSMNTDWAAIGKSIIDGIVNFLVGAKDMFVNAFKSLAQAGADAFKSVFKIGSPSKLMEQYGSDITAGLTVGIDDTASAPTAAMSSMVGPVASGGAGGGAGGGARGGGTVTIGELHVHVGPDAKASDAGGIAQAIKRELESILAGVSIELGAPIV